MLNEATITTEGKCALIQTLRVCVRSASRHSPLRDDMRGFSPSQTLTMFFGGTSWNYTQRSNRSNAPMGVLLLPLLPIVQQPEWLMNEQA